MEIKGKWALITGASRGIGAATAIALAKAGARVLLLARSAPDLASVVQIIQSRGGLAYAFPCDLSKAAETTAVANRIIATHGVPDILINNAGAGRWLFAEETPEGEEDMMIALPYLAAFRITRAFLPGMLSRRSGLIVNINSPVALMTWSGATGYAGSRWALRGFTEALRSDLGGTGVKVCQVVLGETESNYFEANAGARDRLPKIAKLLPILQPEDAARHVLRAIRGGYREYTGPFLLKLMRISLNLFPGIVKYLVRRTDILHPAAKK